LRQILIRILEEIDMQLKQANADFLIGYFSTHDRKDKTRAAYGSDLTQFQQFAGEDLSLHSLSDVIVEGWAAHLRKQDYAPASIKRKMVALKVFCSYWVRRGPLPQSPFWRVKLSFGRIEQLPRTLTENEMRSLLAQSQKQYSTFVANSKKLGESAIENDPNPAYRELRNLALVDFLFATGVRVGEVSSLDLEDYLVKEAVFRIHGKGGRDRLAFAVDERTLQIQQQHFAARMRIKTDTSALFLNASGRRLSTQGISNVIARLCRETGIARHVTPHMFRHTVATLLLRNGADIRVVQEFLGHSSIATTQRYTHITKEHLIGVLQKHHPSLGLRASI
jgi:integrase/recombinase XerD